MKPRQFKTDLAGRELKIEVGQLAQQTNGSVLVRYGGTVVLATCVMSKKAKDVDYLPLSLEYQERYYAAGKIKSSKYLKREGRPSERAILNGRIVDRVIRPLFNQRIRNEIQIVPTILSYDMQNLSDIPALIAVSLALGISDIPWDGPVGGFRVARAPLTEDPSGKKWILNPTNDDLEKSDLDLFVAGKEGKINMLEGGAKEVPEDIVLSAIEFVQPHIDNLIKVQKHIIKEIGLDKVKPNYQEIDPEFEEKAKKWLEGKLESAMYASGAKQDRSFQMDALKGELEEQLISKELPSEKQSDFKRQIEEIFNSEADLLLHKKVLGADQRPDGRALNEVRPLHCQVSFIDRLHGSAIFQRGETQALSVVTLGSPGDAQEINEMEVVETKRYMHHYNFPPFCVGETGRVGNPGRREIGHGRLAEKALKPLIPDKMNFPYTIRVVSEIMGSNGSSSMASTCGSSLALMDAGVPIKSHVAGIAMGLVLDKTGNYKVLTDIQGPEDHHGDIDCKVAGTQAGMTACQMDVKIDGVSLDVLKETFKQAKEARTHILSKMSEAIKEPREKLSSYAPRILVLKIDKNKIGTVIGPGGKMINEIVEQTGVKIDIDDDGLVNITSTDADQGQRALEWVTNLVRTAKVGEVFQGKVIKITDFGAFVEILPGQEGLLHISEISDHHIDRVEDVLKEGQVIPVKVKLVDPQGRIKLTLRGIN